MSSLNIINNNTGKSTMIGHAYSAEQIHIISPSLNETESTIFFNPLQGGCGSIHRADWNLSSSDEFNLNELYLEFSIQNLDAVLTQNIKNPWLLFDSFKILFNNQEVCYYDNAESIFAAQSMYYRKFDNLQLKVEMMKLFPTNYSVVAGETIPVSSTVPWSLPLTILFPWLKNISRSQGLSKLSCEFSMRPNTATPASIGRFILSSTTNNCYTDATFKILNIQLRINSTKHTDPSLRSISNPVMVIQNFETRMYNETWNALTAQKRIQLTNEFSHRNLCFGLLVYIYNNQAVTAYNDTDCMKIDSQASLIGFQIKYKSRTIVDYSLNSELGRRNAYHINIGEKLYKNFNHALIDLTVSDESKYWVPLTFLDFSSIDNHAPDTHHIYSGLSNSGSELEIVLTNTSGVFATSPYIYATLCYNTICQLDPKTGNVSKKQ